MGPVRYSIEEYSKFSFWKKATIAFDDVRAGLSQHEFWRTTGANRVNARYRRSALGRSWLTLSPALFIFILGGLFRNVFSSENTNYICYLSIGYILWLYLSSIVEGGVNTYKIGKTLMQQRAYPLSVFPIRTVYSNLIVLRAQVIIIPIVFLYSRLWPGLDGLLLSSLGVILIIYTSFWVALFMGIIATRIRDIQPLTKSILRMAFFATPVIWLSRDLGKFGEIVSLINPFSYFLSIVRDPLLNQPFSATNWLVAIGISAIMTFIGFVALVISKPRINYWV